MDSADLDGHRSAFLTITVRLRLVLLLALAACTGSAPDDDGHGPGGKADDPFASSREVNVVLTNPNCDQCSSADKDFLRERSPIIAEVVAAIGASKESLDIAQLTFSVREIEAAIVDAKSRGLTIRMETNKGQENGDNVSTRLLGVDVRFVVGKDLGERFGLQHAKFLIADGDVWSPGRTTGRQPEPRSTKKTPW